MPRPTPSPLRWGGALAAALAAFVACAGPALDKPAHLPETRRSDRVDVYHGVEVADPYRWLEEPDAPETRAWVEAQNQATERFLKGVPEREAIRRRLEELWSFERFTTPVQRGGRIFYRRNGGLQDQSVLFVAAPDGSEARVLIDPNELSEDGKVALARFEPSRDGMLLAYGLSDGGSDWRTWRVRGVAGGDDLTDVVTRNKFGGLAWARDASGFFYARYERPEDGSELLARNTPPEICFHRLGTDEAQDAVVVPRPAEDGISQSFTLTEDQGTLIVTRLHVASRTNELHIFPLRRAADGSWSAAASIPLITGFDARYAYVGDDGDSLWVRTDEHAPRWRIVAIDQRSPMRSSWRSIVPQSDHTIQTARAVGGHLIVSYLHDASSEVRVFDPTGAEKGEIELPELGSASGFDGHAEDSSTYYSFTSFTRPPAIYRYDLGTGESEVFRAPELAFDPEDYSARQVFYRSKDGTSIPMFVVGRRDMPLDGSNPTYLYGYGGFNVSMTPFFNVANLVWMEMGGVLAVAGLRGGGEYGEEWHAEGTKLDKQNVFDDFIAGAEYLVRNRFCERRRLAIGGASNGGLLVGACMTQRPELFGAALPAVGVMDMLRYHEFTIGWAWAGDYGTSADPDEFQALLAYSPLHNVRADTEYPATLVTTADHDDRVVPAHSFKFTAALQAAQSGDAPILIRVETRTGHGAGKPTYVRIEEAADRWAFLVEVLGIDA